MTIALHPNDSPVGARVTSVRHPEWGPGTVIRNVYLSDGDYLVAVRFDQEDLPNWHGHNNVVNFWGFGDLNLIPG